MKKMFLAFCLVLAIGGVAFAGMSDVTMMSLVNTVSNSAAFDEEAYVKDHVFYIAVSGTTPTSGTFAVQSRPNTTSDWASVATFTVTTFPGYVAFEAPYRHFRIQYTSKVGGDATTAFTVKYADGVSLNTLY
jgi:hypothetical protein